MAEEKSWTDVILNCYEEKIMNDKIIITDNLKKFLPLVEMDEEEFKKIALNLDRDVLYMCFTLLDDIFNCETMQENQNSSSVPSDSIPCARNVSQSSSLPENQPFQFQEERRSSSTSIFTIGPPIAHSSARTIYAEEVARDRNGTTNRGDVDSLEMQRTPHIPLSDAAVQIPMSSPLGHPSPLGGSESDFYASLLRMDQNVLEQQDFEPFPELEEMLNRQRRNVPPVRPEARRNRDVNIVAKPPRLNRRKHFKANIQLAEKVTDHSAYLYTPGSPVMTIQELLGHALRRGQRNLSSSGENDSVDSTVIFRQDSRNTPDRDIQVFSFSPVGEELHFSDLGNAIQSPVMITPHEAAQSAKRQLTPIQEISLRETIRETDFAPRDSVTAAISTLLPEVAPATENQFEEIVRNWNDILRAQPDRVDGFYRGNDIPLYRRMRNRRRAEPPQLNLRRLHEEYNLFEEPEMNLQDDEINANIPTEIPSDEEIDFQNELQKWREDFKENFLEGKDISQEDRLDKLAENLHTGRSICSFIESSIQNSNGNQRDPTLSDILELQVLNILNAGEDELPDED